MLWAFASARACLTLVVKKIACKEQESCLAFFILCFASTQDTCKTKADALHSVLRHSRLSDPYLRGIHHERGGYARCLGPAVGQEGGIRGCKSIGSNQFCPAIQGRDILEAIETVEVGRVGLQAWCSRGWAQAVDVAWVGLSPMHAECLFPDQLRQSAPLRAHGDAPVGVLLCVLIEPRWPRDGVVNEISQSKEQSPSCPGSVGDVLGRE